LSPVWLFAVYLESAEKVSRITQYYENWQLDELPLALLVLSAGLSWFAFRRTREAHREVKERIHAQDRITELLNQNRELSHSLISLQENERCSLARDLHDEFGQVCTAIRVFLAKFHRKSQTLLQLLFTGWFRKRSLAYYNMPPLLMSVFQSILQSIEYSGRWQ